MSDSFGLVVAIGVLWLAIGLVLSIVMGRRGHNSFGWLVMGTVMGPLAIAMAVDARHADKALHGAPVHVGAQATQGPGPVDVLVGYDGSPESSAAMDAVVGLLGDRLGRLTLATVVSYDDSRVAERAATEQLKRLVGRAPGWAPALEILHGHPSVALRDHAVEGGYELIAVGTRGAGIAKTILGSAASELARDSKVPVLLVGGQHS
jgi:nucleotide-binding universal stress UspA family protein